MHKALTSLSIEWFSRAANLCIEHRVEGSAQLLGLHGQDPLFVFLRAGGQRPHLQKTNLKHLFIPFCRRCASSLELNYWSRTGCFERRERITQRKHGEDTLLRGQSQNTTGSEMLDSRNASRASLFECRYLSSYRESHHIPACNVIEFNAIRRLQ